MEQNVQETKPDMTINLDDLAPHIKKDDKPKTKETKPSQKELKEEFFRRLANFFIHHFAVEGEEAGPNFCPTWPEPDFKFRAVDTKEGTRKLVRISQDEDTYNVCTLVDNIAAVNAIVKYCNTKLLPKNIKGSGLFKRDGEIVLDLWLSLSPGVDDEKIKPVAEKSDKDALCWHRLNFDIPKVAGATPTFDEMFSRFSNGKALMAFIGSLFHKEADKQQYVWIYGEGMNSKGRLANFLAEILGPAFSPQVAPADPKAQPNQFWTKGLLGKRLVVFSDVGNRDFVASAFFKSLTGDDMQRIEDKGGATYSRRLDAKYLLIGNVKPNITNSTGDKRRAILVLAAPLKGNIIPTVAYNAMLMKEAADFLRKALDTYTKLCPGHLPIPTETTELDELLREKYEDEIAIFNLFFRYCTPEELRLPVAQQPKVPYAQVEKILAANKFDQPGRIKKFHDFLKDYLKLEKKLAKNTNDTVAARVVSLSYLGIVALEPREVTDARGKHREEEDIC